MRKPARMLAATTLVAVSIVVPAQATAATPAAASGTSRSTRARARVVGLDGRARARHGHGGHDRPSARASVIGGVEALAGSYPWLAFITYRSGAMLVQCSGTVVAPNVVLTAAHCGENVSTGTVNAPAGYAVVTGNVDWTASPRQVSGVARVVIYPSYDHTLMTGDAALLILSTPTTAPSIQLATYPGDSGRLQAGTVAIIAGWGNTFFGEEELTTRLHAALTVVQTGTYCANKLPPFYPSLELCTVYPPAFETGACHGDSGGPLITLSPTVEFGVISHVQAECSTQAPTVYTRADSIQPWVSEWISAVTPAAPAPTAPPAPAPAPAAPAPLPASTPAPAAPANLPGLYLTRPSRTRQIGLRVSGDGKHIVGLHIRMPVPCRHDYSLPLSISALSYADSVPISEHTAQASIVVAADRDSRAGTIGLRVRFTTPGTLEATLRVHIPSRSARVGLCAGTLRFAAKA